MPQFCKYFLAVLLLSMPAIALGAEETLGAGWHYHQLQHQQLQRHFRVFVPDNLRAHPDAVLLLHGGTQSMRKLFRPRSGGTQEWENLAQTHGFLLLVPNGVNLYDGDPRGDKQNWNDCRVAVADDNSAASADDVGFVQQLLAWASEHYAINASRVYATGASNGGMMSLRLVTELGDRITAAAVFIANQPMQSDCTPPSTPVPLFIMNGTKDPLILWLGGKIRGDGPELMSAVATLEFWLKVNHASKNRVVQQTLPDLDKHDDSTIIKSIYPADPGGQPLWFYEVRGGGHTMPSIDYDIPFLARVLVGNQNRDIEATHEAWNFLSQFSREVTSASQVTHSHGENLTQTHLQ
jgi:polyhydroxybutyrate depolymerase